MTAPAFVDTNVLLYARDAGEPHKQPLAAAWLEWLWRQRVGRTSVQVLSEYYVSVTRKLVPGLPQDEAWDDVMALFTWRPQPIDDTRMSSVNRLFPVCMNPVHTNGCRPREGGDPVPFTPHRVRPPTTLGSRFRGNDG
jgi:hypothetical protein